MDGSLVIAAEALRVARAAGMRVSGGSTDMLPEGIRTPAIRYGDKTAYLGKQFAFQGK